MHQGDHVGRLERSGECAPANVLDEASAMLGLRIEHRRVADQARGCLAPRPSELGCCPAFHHVSVIPVPFANAAACRAWTSKSMNAEISAPPRSNTLEWYGLTSRSTPDQKPRISCVQSPKSAVPGWIGDVVSV